MSSCASRSKATLCMPAEVGIPEADAHTGRNGSGATTQVHWNAHAQQLKLFASSIGFRLLDGFDKLVDRQRAEKLMPFFRVITVARVVLHHETHRAGGAKPFGESFPAFHSDLVQRHG